TLERQRVEEPAETLRDAVFGRLLPPPGDAEQPKGNADRVAEADPVDSADVERFPYGDEALSRVGLAQVGGDVAGVDRADARAGHDLEAHRPAEPSWQLIEYPGEGAGFVRATRTAPGHHQREARSSGSGFREVGCVFRLRGHRAPSSPSRRTESSR